MDRPLATEVFTQAPAWKIAASTNQQKFTMPTYQEYQEQIAKLQALAEQARQDDIAEARN